MKFLRYVFVFVLFLAAHVFAAASSSEPTLFNQERDPAFFYEDLVSNVEKGVIESFPQFVEELYEWRLYPSDRVKKAFMAAAPTDCNTWTQQMFYVFLAHKISETYPEGFAEILKARAEEAERTNKPEDQRNYWIYSSSQTTLSLLDIPLISDVRLLHYTQLQEAANRGFAQAQAEYAGKLLAGKKESDKPIAREFLKKSRDQGCAHGYYLSALYFGYQISKTELYAEASKRKHKGCKAYSDEYLYKIEHYTTTYKTSVEADIEHIIRLNEIDSLLNNISVFNSLLNSIDINSTSTVMEELILITQKYKNIFEKLIHPEYYLTCIRYFQDNFDQFRTSIYYHSMHKIDTSPLTNTDMTKALENLQTGLLSYHHICKTALNLPTEEASKGFLKGIIAGIRMSLDISQQTALPLGKIGADLTPTLMGYLVGEKTLDDIRAMQDILQSQIQEVAAQITMSKTLNEKILTLMKDLAPLRNRLCYDIMTN